MFDTVDLMENYWSDYDEKACSSELETNSLLTGE
jgi:hypothetical protein